MSQPLCCKAEFLGRGPWTPGVLRVVSKALASFDSTH